MFKLNVKRILELRGVQQQFTYLVESGFPRTTAQNFLTGNVWQIKLKQIEKLCVLFNCAPNDLFEWSPDSKVSVADNHPLQALAKSPPVTPLSEIVKDIPIGKLDQVAELLDQLRKG